LNFFLSNQRKIQKNPFLAFFFYSFVPTCRRSITTKENTQEKRKEKKNKQQPKKKNKRNRTRPEKILSIYTSLPIKRNE
jgi:hypothetical protein